MNNPLRSALLWSLLPAGITLCGGITVIFKSPHPGLISIIRSFAAGAVFAVIAIELLPDAVFAHPFASITAFALGVIVMIGVRWLTGKFPTRKAGAAPGLPELLTEAFISILIAGLILGSGFVAGVREGQLLTFALTAEALATGLALIASLDGAGVQRGRLLLIPALLAALITLSAVTGATLLSGRAGVDLDVAFTFCFAALLVRVIESLAGGHEEGDTVWALIVFFVGVILFMSLAQTLGGRHPDHPGRRAVPRPLSQMISSGGKMVTRRFPRQLTPHRAA